MKKIILKEDFDAEVQIFLDFLNSKEYPQHKNIIFFSFPELKKMRDLRTENEKSTVEKFLKTVLEENRIKIQESIIFIKNEIAKHGEKMLEILANLMNYNWKPQDNNYFLIPTIFPLSPFKKNTFFYSIYKTLKGKTEYSRVLAVSAHEISHMILIDILKDRNIKISQELFYFVKELIAPILVYQDDFNNILKKEIVGNYNVLEIYFEKDEKTIRAFDYFNDMFIKNRSEGKNFNFFLDEMIFICKKIESEIKEKKNFDNKYGIQIMENLEILKKFREPIKLQVL